ncbi:MAG: patatin family protein, partial [Clostridia bacterium]|nr:patatin family protein [Clostridia bacterium]
MVGFLDVGGGMKGIYTSGVYDYLMDRGIAPSYCIGVSAGSANLITYIAGQRGRTYRFYHDYAFEKEYMSLSNFLHKGSFIDLHHIYSVLSNEDGRDPLSYDAICASDCRFTAVATDAHTGKPYYLTKSDLYRNDYTVIKASCAMPILGKPINMNGTELFDGGVSDP